MWNSIEPSAMMEYIPTTIKRENENVVKVESVEVHPSSSSSVKLNSEKSYSDSSSSSSTSSTSSSSSKRSISPKPPTSKPPTSKPSTSKQPALPKPSASKGSALPKRLASPTTSKRLDSPKPTSQTLNAANELAKAIASISEPLPQSKTIIIDQDPCVKRKRIAHESKIQTSTKRRKSSADKENPEKK